MEGNLTPILSASATSTDAHELGKCWAVGDLGKLCCLVRSLNMGYILEGRFWESWPSVSLYGSFMAILWAIGVLL